jgi:hypothetical protein
LTAALARALIAIVVQLDKKFMTQKDTMKNSRPLCLVILTAALAFASSPVGAANPKIDDLNVITVEFKLQLQGGFTDDGTVRTYANPTIQKLNTKDLLAVLAADKYAQTNYPANFFPSGSKLGITGAGTVVVVNRNNEFLVDVSDIVRFETSTNGILAGRVDNVTGLARPENTEQAIARMVFDDTAITNGSNLSFVIEGLDTIKTNDTQPSQSTGKYREVRSDRVNSAAGEGQTAGTRFVITGSIKGSFNVTLGLEI